MGKIWKTPKMINIPIWVFLKMFFYLLRVLCGICIVTFYIILLYQPVGDVKAYLIGIDRYQEMLV